MAMGLAIGYNNPSMKRTIHTVRDPTWRAKREQMACLFFFVGFGGVSGSSYIYVHNEKIVGTLSTEGNGKQKQKQQQKQQQLTG